MAISTATEAPKEQELLFRIHVPARDHIFDGRLGVQVDATFGGAAFAPAVPPVIEYEYVHPKPPVEQQDIVQPVADVAGVAVKPQQRHLALARNEPSVQPDAVGGGEENVVVVQVDVAWGAGDLALREIYEVST